MSDNRRTVAEHLQAVASYQSDGSTYPSWSTGEQMAIKYAARDLLENFTNTTFEYRMRVLYDLMNHGKL